MNLIIERLDHIVLAVKSIQATCEFYSKVLGMEIERLENGRMGLIFGLQRIQRINLHEVGKEPDITAHTATPGFTGLCFSTFTPTRKVIESFSSCGIDVVEGPVVRRGSLGLMVSVYVRDPDGNLIEISNYAETMDLSETSEMFRSRSSDLRDQVSGVQTRTPTKENRTGLISPVSINAFSKALKERAMASSASLVGTRMFWIRYQYK